MRYNEPDERFSMTLPDSPISRKFGITIGLILLFAAADYFGIPLSPETLEMIQETGIAGIGGLMGVDMAKAYSAGKNVSESVQAATTAAGDEEPTDG